MLCLSVFRQTVPSPSFLHLHLQRATAIGLSKLKRAPLEDEGRCAAFSFLGICHNMLKKTLIASALTLGLMCATSGVQANPLTNVISGLVNGVGFTDMQFEARRGGFRRSSPTRSTLLAKRLPW